MASVWAASAVASPPWVVPLVIRPGGKPVIADPGLTPTLPEMVDDPVFVTVVPASTANGAALPRLTVDVAAEATLANAAPKSVTTDVAINSQPTVMPWRSGEEPDEDRADIGIESSFKSHKSGRRPGVTKAPLRSSFTSS